MGFAETFRGLDLLEQAVALQELQTRPVSESIPELLPLYIDPTGDAAADTMLRNTLRALYLTAPDQVIAGLSSTTDAVRSLCLDLAGEMQLTEAIPALLNQATEYGDDLDALLAILTAVSRINDSTTLPLFRHYLQHPDPFISALCIQTLGAAQDNESLAALVDIIADNESEDKYDTCEIATWKGIEALGAMGTPSALASLGRFMHHRNPMARRTILETLTRCGAPAIPHIISGLNSEDSDTRIMTANVLRDIGHADAADPLIDTLEKGIGHPNVAFAVYEALGHTPGLKSLLALTEFLPKEREPSCLLAIVQALELQATTALGSRIAEIIADLMAAKDTQAQRILEAVISAKAARLFTFLYTDEMLGRLMLGLVTRSHDAECKTIFAHELEKMDTPRSAADLALLKPSLEADKHTAGDIRQKVLAIDDSAAMRNFYRSHANTINIAVTLAEHGKEALDIIEEATEPFDLIIVDMNMPVMDGIEFTTKIRATEQYARTPVLMATTESGRSQAQLARQSGVTSFLPKPFTAEMLQNRLTKLLDRNS